MKRSEINNAYLRASACFQRNGWALLPNFRWDITDFGLGNFQQSGLVLINLAEEPEYCEKLMYAETDQKTPAHYHRQKKEDIICRTGRLAIRLWPKGEKPFAEGSVTVKVSGKRTEVPGGQHIILSSGERITIEPGIWHEFWPLSSECIIGEVSTANDDANDNFFDSTDIGRFPDVHEDESPLIQLISDKA